MRVRAISMLASLIALGGCDSPGVERITADDILGIVDDSLRGSHDLPLTEIVGVHDSEQGLIVVDRTPPHVRVYRGDSITAVGGKSGDGPGELRRPWRSALSRGELWIVHHGMLSRLTFPSLEEIERATVPRGVLSVHPACGDTITYLITLERGNRASRLAVTSDAAARDDFGDERLARFAPAGLGLYGLQKGDTLIMLDPYRREYRRLSCRGASLESRKVAALEEDPLIPRIHGAAIVGDVEVFATKAPPPEEGTNLLVFYPDGVTTKVHFAGDYRLFNGDEDAAWLVRVSLQPVALRVPKAALQRVLNRG